LYTPNLEYLNVQCQPPRTFQKSIDKTNIKLKQFYLTLKQSIDYGTNFNELINGIKQFSSSLNCLSLNLLSIAVNDVDDIPYNSVKLRQFLESMIELKQFHLYVKIVSFTFSGNFLSQFQDQYWFDHN
jgi:hypothetical protein